MGHRITVKQIADELGVSMMTVSRALNDSPNIEAKTREKVLATAKKRQKRN
jgi:DNA-binding LacI/PurR family transcriptional regulator